MRLTAERARLAAHARDTLERWHELQQTLRGPSQTLAGTISLFASVTACQSFLPRVLSAFRQHRRDGIRRGQRGHRDAAVERSGPGGGCETFGTPDACGGLYRAAAAA